MLSKNLFSFVGNTSCALAVQEAVFASGLITRLFKNISKMISIKNMIVECDGPSGMIKSM